MTDIKHKESECGLLAEWRRQIASGATNMDWATFKLSLLLPANSWVG